MKMNTMSTITNREWFKSVNCCCKKMLNPNNFWRHNGLNVKYRPNTGRRTKDLNMMAI